MSRPHPFNWLLRAAFNAAEEVDLFDLYSEDPESVAVWRRLVSEADEAEAALLEHLCSSGPWVRLTESLPTENQQVLVRHRDSVGGTVCDVACFVGKQPDGELRWILADARLESRQLTHWAEIFPPKEGAA